jgi:hypothetical protein
LTKVPSPSSSSFRMSSSLLTKFTMLNHIDLSFNSITSIIGGDLTLKAPLFFLDLTSNQISSVATSSLPSKKSFIF